MHYIYDVYNVSYIKIQLIYVLKIANNILFQVCD